MRFAKWKAKQARSHPASKVSQRTSSSNKAVLNSLQDIGKTIAVTEYKAIECEISPKLSISDSTIGIVLLFQTLDTRNYV